MSLFPISESDDFVVHYDPMKGMYRVTVFNDGHFWDEYWFDAYEDKEVDDRIDKIINKLEELKLRFKIKMTKQRLYFDANSLEHFINLLINWIKEL